METIGQIIPELIERRLADPAAIAISLQFQTTLFEGQCPCCFTSLIMFCLPAPHPRERRLRVCGRRRRVASV